MNAEVMERVRGALAETPGKILVVGTMPGNLSRTLMECERFVYWENDGAVGSALAGKTGIPGDGGIVLFTRYVRHGEYHQLQRWGNETQRKVVGPWNTGQLRRVLKAVLPQEAIVTENGSGPNPKGHVIVRTGIGAFLKKHVDWKAEDLTAEVTRLWKLSHEHGFKQSRESTYASLRNLHKRLTGDWSLTGTRNGKGLRPAPTPTAPVVGSGGIAALSQMVNRLVNLRAALEMGLAEVKEILGE